MVAWAAAERLAEERHGRLREEGIHEKKEGEGAVEWIDARQALAVSDGGADFCARWPLGGVRGEI